MDEPVKLGNYRLVRKLATGRFSEVYLGEHCYLGGQVALKLLPTGLTPDAKGRFLAEARLLQQLDHPHVIRVRDFGIEDEVAFLVMDYAAGGSLRTRYPAGAPVPLSGVLSFAQQATLALAYLHEHQIIHRDLKPENLLLTADDQLLLGDFGLALILSQHAEYAHADLEGSLGYLAPEQFRGKPHLASDQYALAVIVYEWLCGVRPFYGTVAEICHAHLYLPPPPLTRSVPQISPLIEQVVLTALAKEPGQRFADVRTFAAALTLAAQKSSIAHLLPPTPAAHSLAVEAVNETSKLRSQLPLALTSLIGRDTQRKVLAVCLMQPEVRLLTLTGPGGIGKTSLALSVAHDVQEAFADGVCFVPLAAVHDPELVVPAIAEALEQQTGTRPILEIVQAFLREKHFLLVLDNFEQVVQAAPRLTDLLKSCPDLTIFVTSRETLHLQGEHEFPVPALDLPDLEEALDEATLMHNDAIALFVERAQSIHPDFRLTEANARQVAEICIRLDGLPLALELAAARIKLLPPSLLLARLSNRLDVLTGGRRDAPTRQQTLRNTIKWSYDLLSMGEQQLFRRLSVFVGGCSLEAVEALYRELGNESAGVFEGVASLLDKNLLKPIGQSREGLRILLLETIREFGLECLHASGELLHVRRAHAHYYVSWARIGCQELFGPEQLLWMADLMREMGNLRAVMRFVLEQGEQVLALRLGGALGPLWMFLGTSNQKMYLVESTQFLRQALDGSTGEGTGVRARALALYGGLVAWLGEAKLGELACQQGVELFRQMGDLQGVIHGLWMLFLTLFAQCDLKAAYQVARDAVTLAQQHGAMCTWWGKDWTLGYSLFNVGMIAVYDGHYAEGRAAVEEAVRLCMRAGDRVFSNWSALFLGEIVALEGKDDQARELLEQSVNASRALEMKEQESEALRFLGLLALRKGSREQAAELLAESVRLARETDDTQAIIWALIHAARVAVAQQHLAEARAFLEEGLTLAIARSDTLTLPEGLEWLGFVSAAQGQPAWAACLCGTAQALREAMGEPIPPIDRQEYDARVAVVRAQLDHATFHAAWTQGRRLTAEQVLAAQEKTGETAPVSPAPTLHNVLSAEAVAVGLTRRELEVLRQLSEGLTNAQIAERLVLSRVTVKSYLRSIYSKLGVSSRTSAMRFALDHHLV